MEAITGAIYLDSGFEAASAFIHEFILSDLENKKLFYDAKSVLQEIIQGKQDGELVYELDKEEGPEHDKEFFVSAKYQGEVIGTGKGRTKKAAEQQAAYEAILKLKQK